MNAPTPRTPGSSCPNGPAVPFVASAEACAKADALEGDGPIYSMSELIEITFMGPSVEAIFSGKNMLEEATANTREYFGSATCSVVIFPTLTTKSGEKVSMKCVLPNADADLLKRILSRAERCTYEAETDERMVATMFGMPVLVDVDRVNLRNVRGTGVVQGMHKQLLAHPNAQVRHKMLGQLYKRPQGLPVGKWVGTKKNHFAAQSLMWLGWAKQGSGGVLHITGAGILAYEAACTQAD